MRRAVALLMLAGALVAPASSSAAAFPDAEFENECEYDYDGAWRTMPISFSGKLVDGSGTELAPGAQLAVGDTVKLEGGTVSATLPSWIIGFAFDSGLLPVGESEIPVKAYLALEGTNTAEGVRPPIELTTVARSIVVLDGEGRFDEAASSLTVVRAPLPAQSWTSTGGELQIRQGLFGSLPELPIGFNGKLERPQGSLWVRAAIDLPNGGVFTLDLDCMQGRPGGSGNPPIDVLASPLSIFAAPGFQGDVGGTPLTGAVDADLISTAAPARIGIGASAALSDATLRVRLTDAQRVAWLGAATSVPVTGTVGLVGVRSTQGTQAASVQQTVAVPAAGPATLTLPLSPTTWTAAAANGVDVRGEPKIVLDANVSGVPRRLTLARVSPTDPYPFARFLGLLNRKSGGTITPTPTPTPVATVAPPVGPPSPPAPKKAGVAAVSSKSLKVKSNRVSSALKCTGETPCQGTVVLRSAVKVKRKFVTLTKSVKYTVAAGKTATVQLTLSSAGKQYVRTKKRVSVVLDVKPAAGKTVSKKLTLSR